MTLINKREAVPIKIGSVNMYCEKMKISAKTDVFQANTISGSSLITNKLKRLTHISLSGRIYDPSRPLILAVMANSMNGSENIDVIYRNIKLQKCIVTGFEANDTGEDYIDLTINLATASSILLYTG